MALTPATAGGGVFDTVYRSLRLFWMEGEIAGQVPWQLQIARLLAPLVVGYAAIRGLLEIFGNQAAAARVALTARGHVVVCGLSNTGFRVAVSLREAPGRKVVVVVEKDPQHALGPSCRRRSIPVIFGDATDPAILRAARVDRAKHLFTACGTDSANLDVLTAGARVGRRTAASEPLTAHVFLESQALWTTLRPALVARSAIDVLRVELLSANDLAARSLVAAKPDMWTGSGPIRVGVTAPSRLGGRVAEHALRMSRVHGRSPTTLIVIGDDPDQEAPELVARAPWISKVAEVRAHSVSDLARLEADAVFVCGDDEAANLALGARIAGESKVVDVFVVVADDHVAAALSESRLAPETLVVLPALARALGPDLLRDFTLERLARARHEQYVRTALERGDDPARNASIRPWDELPDSLKDSNRRFADSVGSRLRDLGIGIRVRDPSCPPPGPIEIPDSELERLARAEHVRWADDLVRDGWKRTYGEKDPVDKLHPSLVGWEDLGDAEREKDRDSIRELPAMLAEAGYEFTSVRG